MKTANAASTLASVVFLKIQEFARRPVQEQARLRAQLEAVVAVTTVELAPASRIVLDAADGAAIVVLGDPKGALRLAERALAATAAGLPLCVGVNHGAVQLAPGGRDEDGMIGDGVAARVSAEGHQKFVDGVVVKIRQTIAQGERVLGGMIERVRWQKRS